VTAAAATALAVAAPEEAAPELDDLRPDPQATSPLYLQLVERIAAAIGCGRFKDGEALPAERVLSERLDVSRTTVRKALDELTARGLVTSRQGSGNFVAARLEQPLASLSSFSDDMRARGRRPGFVWVERGLFAPSPEEVIALALGSGGQVARFVRVRLADDEPLAVERAAIAARDLPDPAAVESSLYTALRERGLEPARALQHLRAAAVGPEDARHLGIAPGSPVMATVRYGYLADGRPVEFTRSVYRGDRYDFVAEMRRG
jgi:GntR family transcriptional regulator